MDTPLRERNVLVTREQSQAGALSEMLAKQGALPIECPMIVLDPPEDWADVDQALSHLQAYDGIFFTSTNGVRFFFQRATETGTPTAQVGQVPCYAVGPATEKALAERGVSVQALPERFQAEGLIALLEKEPLHGKRFLIPRARKAREVLPRFLEERGAQVDVAVVYQTRKATENQPQLQRILSEARLDYLTFTSASTVRFFGEMAGAHGSPHLWREIPAACIGEVTAEEARQFGFCSVLVAPEATLASLVHALADDCARRDKGVQ